MPLLSDDDIGRAMAHLFGPLPADLTEWPVDRLDELGAWNAALHGHELVDVPDENPPHGINAEYEMVHDA